MTQRKVLIPDEDHPISVEPCRSTVIIGAGALEIARSKDALTLQEASYAPVRYVPRRDVDMSILQRSSHTTYCPYKGEANYFSIPALGKAGLNSVWTYEAPHKAVADIADLLAFYPDRVSIKLVG